MTDSYTEYLARKKPRMPDAGFDPPPARSAAGLRDYQQLVVDRMLRQGRGLRLRGLRRRQDEDRAGVGSRRRRAHRTGPCSS